MMYVILSGFLPFHGGNQAEVYRAVRAGTFHFDHPEFDAVYPSAKDLISRLLTVDKTKRFTCAQALQHQWFTDALHGSTSMDDSPTKMM